MCTVYNYEAIGRLIEEAEKEVERLKAEGWTQVDFAQALRNLLMEQPQEEAI